MISRPARLRREHFSLAIDQEETAFVPLEDIAVIVLNHQEITLTHPVLSACAEYGIGLYATGRNHQPAGVFLPFLSHSRTTRMLRKQLDITRPTAKRAWASIVRRKIENQATCLRLCGKPGEDRLASYARRIRSGDPDNLEAQAAAFYFVQLFGSDFHRSDERWMNAALDYGYAVLRGAIARGLIAHGLHPTIGLFHGSEQNAFNLADDLIEPFRPLVDLHVVKHTASTEGDLIPADKQALIALLNVDVAMPQGKMSVLSAIEYAVESLVRVYEDGESALELPTLVGLRAHRLEY
ncbi:type II CRISPR-associated endonuclease Cas1 [Pseudothauera rhizosphaerae]|uniref:Type II CRISPR-associated endonuclease Cas1 n=2 Tax=Pseudothauera rhizosphaerae TaxID=2565932 RepID=A0A4S4ALL2_9RHOO|nr:type II CRISPR-associated endonuclease Cas1 [Pseudothauera rhizosphaerae]